MLIVILLAVLALLTLVAAIFGAKFWHWAHVLVVVALFLATVGFVILSARVMDVRSGHMKKYLQASEALPPQEELNAAIQRGTDDPSLVGQLSAREVQIPEDATEAPGVVELEHKLSLASRRLGRVWNNAQTLGPVNPQTGEVTVGIETATPLGVEQGALLYVFEQGVGNARSPQEGRQYLAEFRVTGVERAAGGGEGPSFERLTLKPALALDEREATRIVRSQGPWTLYEKMPIDTHELFAEFSDDQLRQILPEATIEEYLRDGTPWDEKNDSEWVRQALNEDGRPWTRSYVDGAGETIETEDADEPKKSVYRRQLRDYAFLFNELAQQRAELVASAEALDQDKVKLDNSLASAKRIEAYRTKEQAMLKFDLNGVQGDRQAAEALLAKLQRQAERGRDLLEKTIDANARLADELLALQQAAAGGIDLKTSPLPARGAVDRDGL